MIDEVIDDVFEEVNKIRFKTIQRVEITLATLGWKKIGYLDYLKGKLFEYTSSSVSIRNTQWFNKKIQPLLTRPLEAPVLLVYGTAHNKGESGISHMLTEHGFSLMNLTRNGFVPTEKSWK